MSCWSVSVGLFLLLVIQCIASDTKDHSALRTIVVPDQTGSDVVDAVVNIITRNRIFSDEQFFLRRLALVESTDGRDIKNQTSTKYNGGIWKVDKDKFQQTKSLMPVLRPAHEQIRKNLYINWDQVEWSDLRKPLYSGLAAALYILLNTGNRGIPSGIPEQALLWKSIYQPEAPTSIFLEKVSTLELGILNNLCTQKAVKEQRKLPHPSDRKKYIICSAVSIHSIRNCHDGEYFSDSQQVCTQSNCEIPIWVNQKETVPLDKSYPNPCKIEADRICDLIFVSHLYDPTKFIQCDKMGHAILQTCPIDWIWSDQSKACFYRNLDPGMHKCIKPIWDNSNEVGMPLPAFYTNPCKADGARKCDYIYLPNWIDTHKFIRCDRLGKALVKTCPTSSNWDNDLKKCATPCPIPVWDNPNEVGTALPTFYPNPCKMDSARACDFIYVNDIIDNHKFIRCDKLGNALVKTCPISSNWDTALRQCTNVAIITTPKPVITTPKPQCLIPLWDNQNEVGTALPDFYPNPCKMDSARACDFIYVNDIIDNHKFIRCDKLGNALVKTCPISSNWDTALKKCGNVAIIPTPKPIITTPKPQCPIPLWDNQNEVGTALSDFYPNPCNIDPARACDFMYVNYLIDNHKFIRCDKLGHALVKTCPISSNWDTALKKCANVARTTPKPIITTPKPQCPIPLWDNQNEVGTALPAFYTNPCKVDLARACIYKYIEYKLNGDKFIRCDKLGNALVKSCPISSKWDTALKKCANVAITTTLKPVITTTPKPQCPIPLWDNQNEVGTALPDFYNNPCKADLARACLYIYINYVLDVHKFIRCDKLGNALVKSCPISSKWDTALKKCANVAITTTLKPIITTPKPQCPIPLWDNQNEVGTALPDFYPNPCKMDSARACDFIYVNDIIDNHKFIRCDKLGNALVKTCPISSNWDTALKKCTNVAITTTLKPVITTTPKPQCPIPVWDNQNEVGTALPDFYPNPCKMDSARACDFIYVNDIIDNHKFIRCDKLGNALVKTCPISSNWDTALKKCTNVAITTTLKPVITTTPKPQCPIPVWDNQNEVGTALPDFYPNPCKMDSARACDFIYVNDIIDNHKFIRCDKLGNALVKTCPISSNWDTALKKCANVAITTTLKPVITTTPKPQCPIPVWDNQNEVGTALPDFYPNPCKMDSARACDFIYVNDIIDNHKFIRCDKLGNALVKSCPTSSNWDTALNKCGTPSSQCPIPDWDNPNDSGSPLPESYPNPCKNNPSQQCQFIYSDFYLNDHKFIKCDRYGNALVKTCPASRSWDSTKKQC